MVTPTLLPFGDVSEIQRTVERFRAQLLALESAQEKAMIEAYEGVNANLDGRTREIISLAQRRAMTGEGAAKLAKAQMIRRFRDNFLVEMYAYLDLFSKQLELNRMKAVALAQQQAFQTMAAGLPEGVTPEVLARMGIEWADIPQAAFQNIVAVTQPEAPVGGLLQRLGPEAARAVTEELVQSIALGRGPRDAALRVTKASGMSLSKALTIARTETLRAHREASRMQYAANPDLIKGFRRFANKDSRTCMACIALDGELYELDEPLNAHINCRCTLLPETLTYQDLGLDVPMPDPGENGQDWFANQTRETQRKMMGDTKLQAWENGDVQLKDFAKVTTHPVWGKSATVASLDDMGIKAATYKTPPGTRWVCESECKLVDLSPKQVRIMGLLDEKSHLKADDRQFMLNVISGDEATELRAFGPREMTQSVMRPDMTPGALRAQENMIQEVLDNLEFSHNTSYANALQILDDGYIAGAGRVREGVVAGQVGTKTSGTLTRVEEQHKEFGRGPSLAMVHRDSPGNDLFGEISFRMNSEVLDTSVLHAEDVGAFKRRKLLDDHVLPRAHGSQVSPAVEGRLRRLVSRANENDLDLETGDLYNFLEDVAGQVELRTIGGIQTTQIDEIVINSMHEMGDRTMKRQMAFQQNKELIDKAKEKGIRVRILTDAAEHADLPLKHASIVYNNPHLLDKVELDTLTRLKAGRADLALDVAERQQTFDLPNVKLLEETAMDMGLIRRPVEFWRAIPSPATASPEDIRLMERAKNRAEMLKERKRVRRAALAKRPVERRSKREIREAAIADVDRQIADLEKIRNLDPPTVERQIKALEDFQRTL